MTATRVLDTIASVNGVILFDNSALSRFVEETDAAREALIDGFRRLGEPRITALNVYETARTPDVALRQAKLTLYHRIASNVSPLATPAELLALLARARLRGDKAVDASDEIAFGLMALPDLADGDVVQELRVGGERGAAVH